MRADLVPNYILLLQSRIIVKSAFYKTPYIIETFMKGSRDKGVCQFETGGIGIKQIQSEMGRGNQAL